MPDSSATPWIVDCRSPVCGIFQARILEWVAFLCSLAFLGPWLLQQQVWEMWRRKNPGNSTVVWFMAAGVPGIFLTQGSNPHFQLGRWILYHWAMWEAQFLEWWLSCWSCQLLRLSCCFSLYAWFTESMVGKAWVGKLEENLRCRNCKWVYPLWAGTAAVAAADMLYSLVVDPVDAAVI